MKFYYDTVEPWNKDNLSPDEHSVLIFDDYWGDYIDEKNWEDLAARLGQDLYEEHDGWEYKWPLVLRVWHEDKTLIGDFNVEQEAVPQFWATIVKNE